MGFTDESTKLFEAKFIIIAVPTPVKEDNFQDLRPVEGTSIIVAQHIKPEQKW